MRKHCKELARARWFFTGKDQTICFCCGGGLRNREPEDDAWMNTLNGLPNVHLLW